MSRLMKGFIKASKNGKDGARLTVPKHLYPEGKRWVDMQEIDRSSRSGARRFQVRFWDEQPSDMQVDDEKVAKLFKLGANGVAFVLPSELARWVSISGGDIFYVTPGPEGSVIYIQQETQEEPSTLDTPERLAERFNLE